MAFLRKRGKIFHIIYYNRSLHKTEELSTKESNPKIARDMLKDFNAQYRIDPLFLLKRNDKKILFSDAVKLFIADRKRREISAKTEIAYTGASDHFVNICGNKLINDYTILDYDKYLRHFQNGLHHKTKKYSKATIANYTRHIFGIFNWCVKENYCSKNIIVRIKPPEANPTPISGDDRKKIYNELIKKKLLKQYYFLHLTYLLALRKGEAVNLRVEDFDIKNKIIYIRNSKGKRIDAIPMLKDIITFWEELKANNFLPPEGKIFNYQTAHGPDKMWNTVTNDLYLDHKFHNLRAARATDLANSGVELLFLQKFLRHKESRTTLKHYTKLDIDKMRLNMDKKI